MPANPKSIRGVLMPRLKEIRENKGVRMVDLARDTGLHYTFIWRIEQQNRAVGYQSAVAIAEALGVEIKELAGSSANARSTSS
ncbi:MAG: helix-turn-helix transcriptional regulator [Armatimonadota bacterium]